jgi:hypothetical protein
MMNHKSKEEIVEQEEKLPIFKSWAKWYTFMIVYLIMLIVFFYVFTKVFE